MAIYGKTSCVNHLHTFFPIQINQLLEHQSLKHSYLFVVGKSYKSSVNGLLQFSLTVVFICYYDLLTFI